MRRDILGNETSIASPSANLAWTETMEAVLAHSKHTLSALHKVLDEDPLFAQGYAVKGLMLLTLARAEMVSTARECLAKAEAATRERVPLARELAYVETLRHWLEGNIDLAADQLEMVSREFPRDTMAMKFTHAIRFMMGDQHGLMRAIDHVASKFPEDLPFAGYVLGCQAFALEESGNYHSAESVGRRAVELAPRDVWGLHAVAHVLEMTGRAQEGFNWLDSAGNFDHCNNFSYHIHWHRALFALEFRDSSAVLALHDTAIRSEHTDDFRDLANGASLLQRLELDGVDVGDRWTELADIAARRVADRRLVFADLHYLLALLGAKRHDYAQRLVTNMLADAHRHQNYDSKVIQQAGRETALGLVEYSAGHYAAAAKHLMAGRIHRQRIGGSHAQRDVFEQVMLEALIRAGDLDQAERILSERHKERKGHNRFAEIRLARLRSGPDQASRVGALLIAAAPASTHH